MGEYTNKAPGVYIEEITPTGPIAGVGTSTAAFIGPVVKALEDAKYGKPDQITNWTQYVDGFGDYAEDKSVHMPYAVRGFFENGGTVAYIVPIKDSEGATYTEALEALTRVDDVNLVCIPGQSDVAIQQAVLKHCTDMNDRFAILDGPDLGQTAKPSDKAGPLMKLRAGVVSPNGYAALYYPWIKISDPETPADPTDPNKRLLAVPPCGHLAGIYARSDNQRGVHKAPANEIVRGALDLNFLLNDTEQGQLNEGGINALRVFPGGPPMVWGARTTSDGTPWRYINVRRLFMYVEESIQEGIRWAVFEPNDLTLWKKLERTITEFLTRVWQTGALFGKTAKEAFYVRIDKELNPPDRQALGEVIIEIGMAPVRPAEFVIVRIGMWEGGARITES